MSSGVSKMTPSRENRKRKVDDEEVDSVDVSSRTRSKTAGKLSTDSADSSSSESCKKTDEDQSHLKGSVKKTGEADELVIKDDAFLQKGSDASGTWSGGEVATAGDHAVINISDSDDGDTLSKPPVATDTDSDSDCDSDDDSCSSANIEKLVAELIRRRNFKKDV